MRALLAHDVVLMVVRALLAHDVELMVVRALLAHDVVNASLRPTRRPSLRVS